jgi:hypothetical protein
MTRSGAHFDYEALQLPQRLKSRLMQAGFLNELPLSGKPACNARPTSVFVPTALADFVRLFATYP